MTDLQPETRPQFTVSHFDGQVTIALSPADARALATFWGHAHAIDPVRGMANPSWHIDVAQLLIHAEKAAAQNGTQTSRSTVAPVLTLATAPIEMESR